MNMCVPESKSTGSGCDWSGEGVGEVSDDDGEVGEVATGGINGVNFILSRCITKVCPFSFMRYTMLLGKSFRITAGP